MPELIALTALAVLLGLALLVHRHRGRPPKIPEFDGGFQHQHPRVTTIIYSAHVKQKDILK